MYWDIILAEQYQTTPWDVRANCTIKDFYKIAYWHKAQAKSIKIKQWEDSNKK